MFARAAHVVMPSRTHALRPLLCATLMLLVATAVAPLLRAQASAPVGVRSGIRPAFGLHVGAPQKVSLALGAGRWHERAGDTFEQVFVLVEPGLGAGRASIGYLRGRGNLGNALAVRASALRTWRDPWSVAPNMTFVGLETSAHFAVFAVRGGAFRRTAGVVGSESLFTIDLGLFL